VNASSNTYAVIYFLFVVGFEFQEVFLSWKERIKLVVFINEKNIFGSIQHNLNRSYPREKSLGAYFDKQL